MGSCRIFHMLLWAILLSSYMALAGDIEDNGYIFTCPRTLKTGTNNQVQLRRFGNLEAGTFTIKISYDETYSSNKSLAFEQTFDVPEGEKNSKFDCFLEKTDDYVYSGEINITGTFGDYEIGGKDKVYFTASKDNIVLIQTDKPIYKEGDKVMFRVLRTDKHLKPCCDEEADIWVEDPTGTRLFQWKDVSLGKGIKQFEFPLANEPVKGFWKISASFNGEVTSTRFEVKEYVLPKYSVSIKPPSYVLIDAKEIKITICAKYTYGKPVTGYLKLNVSLEKYVWSNDKFPTLEYETKIDGCVDYTINVSAIETEEYYRYRRIQIVANVEESGTGVQRNETQFIQRQYTPLTLSFNDNQKQYFKPGLPYNGKLSVKYPDNTLAADESIQICYTVSRERVLIDWWATKKVKSCRNYTSDENGIVEFIIPPQSTDSVGIDCEAVALNYAKDDSKPGNNRDSLNQPRTSVSLTPWYSPSGSFIQFQPVRKTLHCGTIKTLKLLFTSKHDIDFKLHFMVINQGQVVYHKKKDISFTTDDDVSDNYEDETKLVDEETVQVQPPIDNSKPKPPEEDCPSAREARYVPPIGEIRIELDVLPVWSPTAYAIAYYVRDDRETIADSQKLKIEHCFQNQVKLQFGDEVKQPATKTSLRISASPNSLCGIKVVDKSVSLLNSDDQLTPDKVFSILESFDSGRYYPVNHCNDDVHQPGLYQKSIILPYPPRPYSSSSYEDSMAAFETAGLLVISDLNIVTRPCKSNSGSLRISHPPVRKLALASTARRPPPAAAAAPGANDDQDAGNRFETKSVVEVRDFFPETWLFQLENTGPDGEYITKVKLPHTITEWVGDAVCINEEDGLGISNKTSIRGFQAFFLSQTLPYSIVRGEILTVPLSIFNYVEESLPISVSMDGLEGFEVVGDSIDGVICVKPGTSTNLKVKLKPIALGQQNITFRAETAQNSDVCGSDPVSDSFAKDAIRNSVIVEPEGWPAEDIESVLFCPRDEENGVFKKRFDIHAPEDVVQDSERAYLDVTGNVLGKSLDNLDNLVTMPTGCGEQNMVKFTPNVVAMDVLIATNQLTNKLETNIKRNLNAGAQRQMQYKHPDGSFSAFGTRDKEGSMFLTAFVLRSFSEASQYIPIDNKTLVQMQTWIVSKQQADGCFPDVGRIIDRYILGGFEKDKSLGAISAYVLASLLISNYKNQTVLDSALVCLKNSKDDTFYATFLIALAEALAGKEESAKERIAEARKRAIVKGGTEYFHDVNGTKSQDIETAGYAVQAILKSGGSASEVLSIIRYLTSNLNPQGGFYSTQDTVVGLKALGEFAKLTFQDPVSITMKTTGGLEKEITITEDEKLIVKRYKITAVPSTVDVEASGEGCALLQAITRYNTHTPPEKRSFDLTAAGECLDGTCRRGKISISFSYIPEGGKTGMALVEVKMISGIVPDKDSLNNLLGDKALELMRVEVENNKVIFYFSQITNIRKSLSFEVEKLVDVGNAQPGTVTIYDYYNRDITTSTTYSLNPRDENSP